jgi:hypothetical protein
VTDPVPRPGPARDPDLDHQVILAVTGRDVWLTCNCLRSGQQGHHSMGSPRDYDETRALYNNPRRHARPFGPEHWLKDWRYKAQQVSHG